MIVDTLPISKQQLGSAWGKYEILDLYSLPKICGLADNQLGTRMSSGGHLIGYFIGTLDLVNILGPFFGDSQFKQLTLIAALALIITIGITSWAVEERVLISRSKVDDDSFNFRQIIRDVILTSQSLPARIQAICNIQLWSWIGWFPFHFYSTTFVGEIYFRYDAPYNTKSSSDALGDIGRIGSMALVLFSGVNFIGALLLPQLVKSPDNEGFTSRPPVAIAGIVENFNKSKPDLLTAWIYGHILFTCTMIFTPFARSLRFATFLVATCGISWSLSSWAPATYMGMEVNRLSESRSSISLSSRIENGSMHNLSPLKEDRDTKGSEGEVSGLYFGILNIYTTIPQFIGTFISMFVFYILEPGKSPELVQDSPPNEYHSTEGPNAISVCLLIGAGSMIGAAFATRKLRDMYKE